MLCAGIDTCLEVSPTDTVIAVDIPTVVATPIDCLGLK